MTFTAKNRHQVALFLPPLVCAISVSNSFIEINTGRENRQMPCCCGSVDCAVKMTPLTAVSGGNGERSRSVCVCVCTCPYTCASVRRTGCDPPPATASSPGFTPASQKSSLIEYGQASPHGSDCVPRASPTCNACLYNNRLY